LEPTLPALARELGALAATIEEAPIARRLIGMADEVWSLAEREAADSAIYHSATLFLHREANDIAADPYEDSSADRPT
jgi:uncharacterized protein involved in propanediol utilization